MSLILMRSSMNLLPDRRVRLILLHPRLRLLMRSRVSLLWCPGLLMLNCWPLLRLD